MDDRGAAADEVGGARGIEQLGGSGPKLHILGFGRGERKEGERADNQLAGSVSHGGG